MDNDDFIAINTNISTIADLLDTKGISWGEYQEHQPYPGFQGFNYSVDHTKYPNDYVRKHNPLIHFASVNTNDTRLALLKNFTDFEADLSAKMLPQWFFVTPNMTNDGHDTSITVAAKWARNWLTPLLNNKYLMEKALILLTFDENKTYTDRNVVYSLLLGGAIPRNLRGTKDNTFYTHYSTISSVSMNWDLPSLGRWDCNANVFQLVANATKYKNKVVDSANLFLNISYPGPLSDASYVDSWPVPDTLATCAAGKGTLASIKDTWGENNGSYNYSSTYPYDNTNAQPSFSIVVNPSTTGSGGVHMTTGSGSAYKTSGLISMALVGSLLAIMAVV